MIFLFSLILSVFMPHAGYAQTPNLTQEQRSFVESYVEAAQDKDEKLYWHLIHPQSRACMSESFKTFTIQNFIKKSDEVGQLDVDTISIKEVDMPALTKQVKLFYRDKAFLSVDPNYSLTSTVVLDDQDNNACGLKSQSYEFSVPVAFYDGAWYEVMPCGKNDLDTFLDKQLQARAHQKTRSHEIYSSVPQGMWDRLSSILSVEKDPRKAVNILRDEENLSVSEAEAVIEMRCDTLSAAPPKVQTP